METCVQAYRDPQDLALCTKEGQQERVASGKGQKGVGSEGPGEAAVQGWKPVVVGTGASQRS